MNRKFDFEEKPVFYNCLTVKVINKIKNTNTVRKRNEMVIEVLGRRQQLEKLIEALAQSNQKHLVKYLEVDGSESLFKQCIVCMANHYQLSAIGYSSISSKRS